MLVDEVLNYLQMNNYRRASYDRLFGIIPSAKDVAQLDQLVNDYSHIFKMITIRGGLPGLKLQDSYNFEPTAPEVPMTMPGVGGPSVAPFYFEIPVNGYKIEETTPVPNSVTEQDVMREVATVDYMNVGRAIRALNEWELNVGQPPESLNLITLCVMTLRNGFTIIGKSACVSASRYNKEMGQDLAYKDACKQIWPFLGFRLADRLSAPTVSVGPGYAQVNIPHHPV